MLVMRPDMKRRNYKNPKDGMHKNPSGFQVLTFDLKSFRDVAVLMESGNISHVFGPLNDKVSVPQFTVCTL